MSESQLDDVGQDARALSDEYVCDCDDDYLYPTGPDGLAWHSGRRRRRPRRGPGDVRTPIPVVSHEDDP